MIKIERTQIQTPHFGASHAPEFILIVEIVVRGFLIFCYLFPFGSDALTLLDHGELMMGTGVVVRGGGDEVWRWW